ncbi:MAG TPA: dihydrolipoamide acetyltransferase family protein [Fimbriimonadaceae bacterium]|nr:dihydrolipoamide acetyltransferase family protein [Fimbriimonadaceae bacterium]
MAVDILFPELGESVHEGQVSRWLKHVGDFVKEDEPVVEIMTDKVNTELPSPASGFLVEITVPEGGEVEVFSRMGVIEEDEKKAKAILANGAASKTEPPAPKKEEKKEQVAAKLQEPIQVPAAMNGRKWYTPLVRAMARTSGVSDTELASISGSGHDGRVTKRDLEAYISGRSAQPKTAAVVAGPDQQVTRLTGLRKMIADQMVRSSQTPVVSTLIEVDLAALVDFRSANKESFEKQNGVKLTYTPFFIEAIANTLVEYPALNSSMSDNNEVVTNRRVHMGVAVSLGEDGSGGLIVPVIRDCQNKNLVEISKALADIAKKARTNSLETEDVQGGTFTLTNPGSYGATLGTPMINAPQAGILGTYGIIKRPVVINDMIAIRPMMNIVLTYDHRLVDGMTAGLFLQSLKKKLEGFDFYK